MTFLKELNPQQLEAATNFNGPMLILAGAGSGKTKTVVTRAANMIANGISGKNILILTFTNKAAKEMKERGESLLDKIEYEGSRPFFTTFHSFGFKFLKRYANYSNVKVNENFSLADEGIQKKIIKNNLKGMFLYKEERITEKNIIYIFGILQNNLVEYNSIDQTYSEISGLIDSHKKAHKSLNWLRSNHIETKKDILKLSEMYVKYKRELRENNLVDFEDLISLPIRILKSSKEIKQTLNNKFKYIMIDEFQDTNYSQIEFLNLLMNKDDNICVVGDDSQSIYGWRGADIEYILNFHKSYRKVKKINLTHNYRSTEDIVQTANKLIENAEEKHEFKEALQAFQKEKGFITKKQYYNEYQEAEGISFYINKLFQKKVRADNIAILYRNNFIASTLEKEFIKKRIPYRIYKGRSLMQKKSIQEYMSFIHFIMNKHNEIALESALIAGKTLTQTKINSIKETTSLKDYLFKNKNNSLFEEETSFSDLGKAQKEKVNTFIKNMNIVRMLIKNDEDTEIITDFIDKNFNFMKSLRKTIETSKSPASIDRAEKALEDIAILTSIIKDFNTMIEFLETIGLNENTESDETENKVNLMTIHSSKGLEFDCVFLARMNQGILPSNRSLLQDKLLEEERRLAYVGITRAKRFLHISYIKKDRQKQDMFPSIFISEAGL